MVSSLKTLSIALILIIAWAFFQGGAPLLLEGLENSLSIASRALPLILIAFIVIGLLQLLISGDSIKGLLGRYPGIRGILLTSLAGGLLPGGPYVFYPLASSAVAKQGVSAPVLYSFVAGKHAWDVPRLPLEISLAGPELALWRNLLTLPYPLVMALVVGAFQGKKKETPLRQVSGGENR